MKEIAWDGYLFSQPDSAFHFAHLMCDFAKSINNKKWKAIALNIQGISFSIRGDLTKAIDYYTKSLKIHEGIRNKTGIAGCL